MRISVGQPASDQRPVASRDWLLWQLADSAFPAGGFAHSGGLESAWQHGEIRSAADLTAFMETSLEQAGHATLPFVAECFLEPARFVDLDRQCHAFLSNQVANRASRAQGQAFLLAAERAFALDALRSLRALVRDARLPGHLAAVFGAAACALQLDLVSTLRLFLFLHLRGLTSAAVRLGIIGPMDAQGMLVRLAPFAESVSSGSLELRAADASQTAPLLEVLHGAHDRLYSRLFQS